MSNNLKAAKVTALATIVAAVLGAVIAGIFVAIKPDKAASETVTNSPCGIVKGNQINCNNPPGEPYPVTSQAPVGGGPWPFRTINTWSKDGSVDRGAVVRPCKDENCGCAKGVQCRLGVARGNTTVYAVCVAHSTFAGVPGRVEDSVWFKIKWPNNTISPATVFTSTPRDPYTGWILGSSLAPEGHNGNIPACS